MNTKGIGKKNRHKIDYPNIPSAIRPVPHSESLPVPIFSGYASSEDENDVPDMDVHGMDSESADSSSDAEQSLAPHCFNQEDLNDLIRDLALSKKAAKLLASRLSERHKLNRSIRVSYYQTRESKFVKYLSKDKQFVYCHDVPGLFTELGLGTYSPAEWRLFLDSSKRSLKCVLLHNGNNFGAVPLGHSVHLRETHDDIRMVMDLLKYHEHN